MSGLGASGRAQILRCSGQHPEVDRLQVPESEIRLELAGRAPDLVGRGGALTFELLALGLVRG